MQFLHLSAADHGGAGLAAWRMHEALRQLGHGSRMLVLDRRTTDDSVVALGSAKRWFRARRWVQKALMKFSTRDDYYFQNQRLSLRPNWATALGAGPRPDVIVVHFVSHFLGFDDVQLLQAATGAPVLWNLLDMGLLTGGCHYAWDCQGYQTQCGRCPALRLVGGAAARGWCAKQAAVAETRGWVVAGSSTLARQAAAASLFRGHHIETLLLGVSPATFKPADRGLLRAQHGVDPAAQVVFFGAQKFSQRRKGMHLLMQALLRLADNWPVGRPLPTLLSAGNASDFAPARQRGFPLIELGYVDTPVLALCYAAADVFACPSIEDSGPMMINEAMMSGTPVVAFRMGVVDDLLEDGITGGIAPLGDVQAFAAALAGVLNWDSAQAARARARCREIALEKCLPERQLARFVDIARRLCVREGATQP
jgi:glycosyltransferase involved in cell wall biosynthesis